VSAPNLAGRVALIDEDLGDLRDRLGALAAEVAALRERVGVLEGFAEKPARRDSIRTWATMKKLSEALLLAVGRIEALEARALGGDPLRRAG
jgi:hypothetical protein